MRHRPFGKGRPRAALTLALAAGAWLALGAGTTAWSAPFPDLSGTYWATEYHARIQPLGGSAPPLNDAGKAAYKDNSARLRNKSLKDYVRSICLPDGIPRLLSTPYPFEVFQVVPGQVTFVHELNNQVRVVPLTEPPASDKQAIDDASYEGHAAAHYEGDALIIRSAGFNDQTFLDSTGLPHGDNLVTTERVRKVGSALEDVVTIHDPEFYSRDWKARFVYQRQPVGFRLQEYVCGEPHRDISRVKGIPEVRRQRARGLFP